MYVCICIHMYVCVCIYIYVRMYTHVYVRMYTHIYVRIYMRILIYMICTSNIGCIRLLYSRIHAYAYIYILGIYIGIYTFASNTNYIQLYTISTCVYTVHLKIARSLILECRCVCMSVEYMYTYIICVHICIYLLQAA